MSDLHESQAAVLDIRDKWRSVIKVFGGYVFQGGIIHALIHLGPCHCAYYVPGGRLSTEGTVLNNICYCPSYILVREEQNDVGATIEIKWSDEVENDYWMVGEVTWMR